MKIKNIINKFNNKGFTLVELLIAVSLTALVIAGSYVIYSKNADRKKVNVEIANISSLIKKIENVTVSSDYSQLSNAELATLGVSFISEFENPEIRGISPKSYSITYNNIKSSQCADFSPKTQLNIASLQKIITKINGQEFIDNNIKGMVEACSNKLNEVVIVVNANINTDLSSVGQDAPPPNNIPPTDLNINPASPPSGVVPEVPHQNTGNPNIPEPGNVINPPSPTSPPPTGMGEVPNNEAPPPINIVAPKPPVEPPSSSCGKNEMCCYDYRGGPKSYTCVAANRVVDVVCPAGSPTVSWYKTEHWKFDWHYSPTEPKEIIVTSSWYMSSVDDESAHFCAIKMIINIKKSFF